MKQWNLCIIINLLFYTAIIQYMSQLLERQHFTAKMSRFRRYWHLCNENSAYAAIASHAPGHLNISRVFPWAHRTMQCLNILLSNAHFLGREKDHFIQKCSVTQPNYVQRPHLLCACSEMFVFNKGRYVHSKLRYFQWKVSI